jgi:DNA-directed RNA polymerase specialized sigma24 family protein
MKTIAASLSRPGATTRLSTIRTTKDRADDASPAVRDAMFAAVPSLRAFAISLSGNVDRADDLVQETLLRAIANINSFHPGTNMSAWLFASSATYSARNTASGVARSKTPTAATRRV